jgi:hypothetical protein
VQALYHLTKTMDSTRPVIGNDGWESIATDMIGIHDYDADGQSIAGRYGDEHDGARLLNRERPGGRLLVLHEYGGAAQPLILSEFGGIAFSPDPECTWGYSRCETAEEFLERLRGLVGAVRASSLLAGYCYTQFTDTYQEANGLLYADRTPKIPLEAIAQINGGELRPKQEPADSFWRTRLMELQFHLRRLTEEVNP